MQADKRHACRWIHRATLKKGGVEMVGGVQYEKVDDDGLHVKVGRERRVRLEDVFLHRPVLQPARERSHCVRLSRPASAAATVVASSLASTRSALNTDAGRTRSECGFGG